MLFGCVQYYFMAISQSEGVNLKEGWRLTLVDLVQSFHLRVDEIVKQFIQDRVLFNLICKIPKFSLKVSKKLDGLRLEP